MASSATATAPADGGHDPYLDEAVRLVETTKAPAGPATDRREVHAAGHEWEWQLGGACRAIGADEAELFFHPWGERDPSRGRRDRAAKAICATCPVMSQCRDYALATR